MKYLKLNKIEGEPNLSTILIYNYYENTEKLSKEESVAIAVDIEETFKLFFDKGKEFSKKYLDSKEFNIEKYKVKIEQEYQEWIENNGYPYSELGKSKVPWGSRYKKDAIDFFKDCIEIYAMCCIKRCMDKMFLNTTNDVSIAVTSSRLISKSIMYLNIIFSISSVPKERILFNNNNSFEEIHSNIELTNKYNLTNVNYKYNNSELKIIKNKLLYYLGNKVSGIGMFQYNFSRQRPIEINNKNYLCYSAASVIAVAFYRLLLTLNSDVGYKMLIPCRGSGCIEEIQFDGNTKYCKKCKDNSVPEKMKRRRTYINKLKNELAEEYKIKEYLEKKERLDNMI